jgi:hypothetical protein
MFLRVKNCYKEAQLTALTCFILYGKNGLYLFQLYLLKDFPKIKDKRNNTMKMANKIFAIEAAPEAIPPKPKIAAMIAITKNVTVQRNITVEFKSDYNLYRVD